MVFMNSSGKTCAATLGVGPLLARPPAAAGAEHGPSAAASRAQSRSPTQNAGQTHARRLEAAREEPSNRGRRRDGSSRDDNDRAGRPPSDFSREPRPSVATNGCPQSGAGAGEKNWHRSKQQYRYVRAKAAGGRRPPTSEAGGVMNRAFDSITASARLIALCLKLAAPPKHGARGAGSHHHALVSQDHRERRAARLAQTRY